MVFFRDGIYDLTLDGVQSISLKGGTEGAPVVYESYPGEKAVFDGSTLSPLSVEERTRGTIYLPENYTILRNVEVRNMPGSGVRISGNYNIVEGNYIHDNHIIGIYVHNRVDGYSVLDTGGSHNVIRDNVVQNNSDAGLFRPGPYDDGNSGDGIALDSGVGNLVSHNTVFDNSDDGIDTWKSINSVIEYNLVYGHGKGAKGGGNGFKLGGDHNPASALGTGSIARHNIAYNNRSYGFAYNSGKEVLMENNTAYRNSLRGFVAGADTILRNNIASMNGESPVINGVNTNNSWDTGGQAIFINTTNPDSSEFLKPVVGNDFENIGAYAVEENQ